STVALALGTSLQASACSTAFPLLRSHLGFAACLPPAPEPATPFYNPLRNGFQIGWMRIVLRLVSISLDPPDFRAAWRCPAPRRCMPKRCRISVLSGAIGARRLWQGALRSPQAD